MSPGGAGQPSGRPAAARVSRAFRVIAPGRALAPLPFARGRPCSLLAMLAFSPGCLPRKTRFCWRQNEVNLKKQLICTSGSLPSRKDPGFCWEASEGSPGLSTVVDPISFETTALRSTYLMLKLQKGWATGLAQELPFLPSPSVEARWPPSLGQPRKLVPCSHCSQLTSSTMLRQGRGDLG